MKNTLPCDIVRDILPLYIDDVVSETTKNAVAEHLESCHECKNEYISLKATFDIPIQDETSKNKFVVMMRKQRTKRILSSILLIILSCSIFYGILYMTTYRKISLGSILPDDFTDVAALHIKNGTEIAAIGSLNQEIYEPLEGYKRTLDYVRVKKFDSETDGHISDEYYIIMLGRERLIIFDDETVLVSKDGVYTKYILVDHPHNLIGNEFVWR